jgi:hypothetical protein
MRHSNHRARESRQRDPATRHPGAVSSLVRLVLLVLIVGACGQAAAPSASPAPLPTPVITPDPHLAGPVTADQVLSALSAGRLTVYANNATGGPAPIVKRINADLDGWPLRITAYTTAASSRQGKPWKAGTVPGKGEAAYTLAALNLVIEYGPKTAGVAPAPADAAHMAVAASLVAILDPLLWPIEQHSVATIPARTSSPAGPSPAPSKPPKAAPSRSKAP